MGREDSNGSRSSKSSDPPTPPIPLPLFPFLHGSSSPPLPLLRCSLWFWCSTKRESLTLPRELGGVFHSGLARGHSHLVPRSGGGCGLVSHGEQHGRVMSLGGVSATGAGLGFGDVLLEVSARRGQCGPIRVFVTGYLCGRVESGRGSGGWGWMGLFGPPMDGCRAVLGKGFLARGCGRGEGGLEDWPHGTSIRDRRVVCDWLVGARHLWLWS